MPHYKLIKSEYVRYQQYSHTAFYKQIDILALVDVKPKYDYQQIFIHKGQDKRIYVIAERHYTKNA